MQNEFVIEPANYYCDDFITDIDFHPSKDFICCGTIEGDAKILKYTQEDTVEVFSKQVNKTPTR
jgi:WD repeat-containing protein 55